MPLVVGQGIAKKGASKRKPSSDLREDDEMNIEVDRHRCGGVLEPAEEGEGEGDEGHSALW